MKLGKIGIYYISPVKSNYDLYPDTVGVAKRELLKINSLRRRFGTAIAFATIAVSNINMIMAQSISVEEFTTRVDEKGMQVLTLLQSIGYWAAILFAAVDIIKNIKKQDTAGIVAVVLKYVTIYGVLYALPWIFDLIKTLFAF